MAHARDPAPADAPAPATPAAFHPSAAWKVKPLQDKQSQLKICTLSTQFNNGFFVQMTAAQEGINSISINFRQPTFARGTTANVGIAAPGVAKSVLPAVAFKPELLAIDFQGQGALFDAIKNAGVMDFSMGPENQFRFYLNGFSAALPKLAGCMKTHASPGAGVEIPVPVTELPPVPQAAAPQPAAAPAPVPLAKAPAAVPAPPPQEQLKSVPAPLPAKAAAKAPARAMPPVQKAAVHVPPAPVVPPRPVLSTDVLPEPPAPVAAAPRTPALEVISAPPPASAMADGAVDERAPKGPPLAKRAAMAVTPPTAANLPEDATTLRSANIDQERGRAPPPPPRRLSEIEAPPVFTNSEPVIGAPSAEAIAKSKAAMEKYQQEMSLVMPEQPPRGASPLGQQLKKPAKTPALQVDTLPMPDELPVAAVQPQKKALDVITPEGTVSGGVLDPGPRRPAIRGKRLTQMLNEDMQQQYEQMGDEGRLRPDIRQKLEEELAAERGEVDPAVLEQPAQQYELKPLVAPLVKKGSAEEKALADILGGEPAAPAAAPPVPVTPALPQSAPGLQQPSPILSPDSQLSTTPQRKQTIMQGNMPLPMPHEANDDTVKIKRQTKQIEVDLTGNVPPPPSVPTRQGKSWLDILREKQEQQNASPAAVGDDGMSGVYVPDGAAAPTTIRPVQPGPDGIAEVEVDSVPALSPRRKLPPLTRDMSSEARGIVPSREAPAAEPMPDPRAPFRPKAKPAQAEAVQVPAPILRPDPVPTPAMSPVIGDSVLAKKIAIMEQQLATLTKENVELEAELAHALEQGKQEKVAIESDNWNLESSTNQYNEAKRQIDRLGGQIQKERAQCTAEKKELEALLFDPQVTQEAQLARLAELEDALNAADRKLEEQRQIYEGRIKLLEAQGGVR